MANYFGPYDDKEQAPAPDAVWTARRRLAASLRTLNQLTVTSVADAEALNTIAQNVDQQIDVLAGFPQAGGKIAQIDPLQDYASQRSTVSHEISPMTGLSNPQSPPLNIWFEGDKVKAQVIMGWQYEGPPSCIHGGYIAALFDDFLGVGQKLTGQIGFTGTLKIRYLKPTPLNQTIDMIGWLERQDGRKTTLCGEMYAGDTLTATCEGLFIQMPTLSYRDDDHQDNVSADGNDRGSDHDKASQAAANKSAQIKQADAKKARP